MRSGKISRVLAAKLSLCVRVDALSEAAEAAARAAGVEEETNNAAADSPADPSVGVMCRRYVENRLEQLEQGLVGSKSLGGRRVQVSVGLSQMRRLSGPWLSQRLILEMRNGSVADAAKPAPKPAYQRYEPRRGMNGAVGVYDTSTDAVNTVSNKSKKPREEGEGEAEKPKKKKIKVEQL